MFCNWIWAGAAVVCFGMVQAAPTGQDDEDAIRYMVTEAMHRLNQGDTTGIHEFWDENADYVGVDGQLIRGQQASFR